VVVDPPAWSKEEAKGGGLSLDLRPRGYKDFFLGSYTYRYYRRIYMGGLLRWAGLDWTGRSGWDALVVVGNDAEFYGLVLKRKNKKSILAGIYK
jgi:hypothetical protein